MIAAAIKDNDLESARGTARAAWLAELITFKEYEELRDHGIQKLVALRATKPEERKV